MWHEMIEFSVPDLREKYVTLLAPLFDPTAGDTVEYVFTLTRAGGMQDAGWDPAEESKNFVQDLSVLIHSDSMSPKLADARLARWRMAVLAYAHLVEMDAPYNMIANLMRVRLGKVYSINPLRKEGTGQQVANTAVGGPKPGPTKKLPRLRKLAQECGCVAVVDAIDAFYMAPLRNAVSHSDFAFYEGELRAPSTYFNDGTGLRSPSIKLERLRDVIGSAFWFYAALFECEHRAKRAFTALKGKWFRYDEHYKGILELLFEDVSVCGLRLHWPNGSTSTWSRTSDGCSCINMHFGRDGSLEPMVGLYARRPGAYSPLVEQGAQPIYSALTDGSVPTWDEAVVPDGVKR